MPAEQASADARRKAAREVIDILHEIATLLVRPQAVAPTCDLIDKPAAEHAPRPSAALLLRIAHRKRGKSRSACRKFIPPFCPRRPPQKSMPA